MKPWQYLLIVALLAAIAPAASQSLDDYLREAAANNPGLRAKFANYEAALQRIPQVGALPDPRFSFAYFISPAETRVGPQRLRLSLVQMFPWFGTLAARESGAALSAAAGLQSFLDARNKLFLQVKQAYYPLFVQRRHHELLRTNHAILLSYKDLATLKFSNGEATMYDVIRVDMLIDKAESEIRVLEAQERALVTRFNSLLNRPPAAAVQIPEVLMASVVSEDYRRDSLLQANPQLSALDLRVQSLRAEREVALKQGMPQFGIGLDYVAVDQRIDVGVPDNGKDILMPMLSIGIPIYRGGYDAAVEEVELRRRVVEDAKSELTNRLIADYAAARYELDRARHLLELYAGLVVKAEQSKDLLIAAYRNSGIYLEEVLRMQQDILGYRMDEASALSDFNLALAKLDYLTAKQFAPSP